MRTRSEILSRLILVCIFTVFVSGLWAHDKIEEKLADALAKANRTVAHDQEKAQEAGRKLNEYCKDKSKGAGIRPVDGLWGCVVIQPQPLPPPGTNR